MARSLSNESAADTFKSVKILITAIYEYIDQHNANPTKFVWTKSAA